MDIEVIIKDEEINEQFIIKDINDINHFSYMKEDGVQYNIDIYDDGIEMQMLDFNHESIFVLRKEAYIEIKSIEGNFKILPKIVAFNKNNDIITIVYTINEIIKRICIKFIGV